MVNLPNELIYEILLYLPAKSLLRFKSVSKSFSTTISSKNFTNSHLMTSSAKRIRRNLIVVDTIEDSSHLSVGTFNINGGTKSPHEEFLLEIKPTKLIHSFFRASCNGLILSVVGLHEFAVWNPFTREYKILPRCPMELMGYSGATSLSFGYDSSKDDYKVLVIKEIPKKNVWILGFQTGFWKSIQDFPYVEYKIIRRHRKCFADGALHFLCDGRHQSKTNEIIAFDVVKENFSMISKPDCITTTSSYSNLDVIEGSLCWIWSSNFNDVKIHVRKKHGIDFTWSKLWSVTTQGFPHWIGEIIGYSKEGDRILFLTGCPDVYSYDLVEGDVQKTEFLNIDYMANIVFCIESLVPINFSKQKKK